MSKPFISFIVPVFNAVSYLGECLDSLRMDGAEIIVIDDGSTDGSTQVAAEFVAANPRAILLQGPRKGAGAARNCGLDIAQGEYVVFVDADDYIDPRLFQRIKERAGFDMIYFGYKEVTPTGVNHCPISPEGEFSSDIDIALTRLFRSPERFFGFTWNKAFKRQIIEEYGIRFNPDLIIKEDEEFCLQFANRIESLYIIGAELYNYRILPDSLSHRKLRDRKLTLLAETIEQTARACPWPELKREVIIAANEYHLDGFRDSGGASFDSWQAYVRRNRALLSGLLSARLFALPGAALRRLALRLVYTNPAVGRIKALIKKLGV